MPYIESIKTVSFLYDFSVDGGTIGDITPAGSPTIPSGAVAWLSAYNVITTCTSATDAGDITVALPTDGAFTDAPSIGDASNPWDAGVYNLGLPSVGVMSASFNPVARKTTASRRPVVRVGTENLTAGKILFVINYYLSI